MTSRKNKDKIWDLIKDIKVGMLVTMDGADMRARPMHLVQEDYDGILWFFTKSTAPKMSEIEREHDVCLTFTEPHKDIYVSLSGRASLSRDRMLIDNFWNSFVSAWFPEGRDDPDLALLRIHIHMGEHWDSKQNKMVQLYEIAKANITGETPDMGENRKFG